VKFSVLISVLSLVLGVALGFFVEDRLDKPVSIDCEVIDYQKVEAIVARQVKQYSVQPFDVSKIKHVKSFTYAPVVCNCDSLAGF
jgi:uncharacterized protein YneF (UPF0154 family)